MSIARCYRKHSPSVCEPQPFRKVIQISSTMIKDCTWLKSLNYQRWPHVLPKHVFPEGSRIFKPGKPQNPPSLGLPGGIQVEIRVVRSHLQIDPPGKFGSDPAGGGCHTFTAAHKDISQQVLPLLLWGASTIGLQATQRNHGINYLHPVLKENKKKSQLCTCDSSTPSFFSWCPSRSQLGGYQGVSSFTTSLNSSYRITVIKIVINYRIPSAFAVVGCLHTVLRVPEAALPGPEAEEKGMQSQQPRPSPGWPG